MIITNFKQLESAGTMKRADARKALISEVYEEPGFNLRDLDAVDAEGLTFEQRLEALAEHIAAGGAYPPLEVRVRPEGGVYVVDGHRRRLALLKLIAHGRLPADPKDGKHWVAVVPFAGNDAQRLLRVMTSNESQKLSSIERARGYQRLRAFDWSAADIAKGVGKSVQHVNDLLALAGSNSDVQAMVKSGDVAASVAVATVRKHGEAAGSVLKAVQVATGKAKVTAGATRPARITSAMIAELIKCLKACATDEQPTNAQLQAARQVLKDVEGLAS